MFICKKCGKEHDGSFGSGNFCCRSCANSRIHSKETKLKISKTAKLNVPWNKGKTFINYEERICPTCKKEFKINIKYKKVYCCAKCNPNNGGYREGSGRSHSGYYKGIYCGSTYELIYVLYRLENNLPVKRFKGYLQNEKIKYYPDFIENENNIVEIKGYHTDLVDDKCKLAIEKGYNIKVLYLEDLNKYLNWIKLNFNYKHIEELYDNYKPKYEYTCDCCRKEFYRNKPIMKDKKYCSRSCACKCKKRNPHSEETKNKLRIINIGKHHTEETKIKMKISQRNRRKKEKFL